MQVTGVSKKGGRPVNEDAYGEVRVGDVLCAVVADGLGGHSGGHIASRIAVDTIISKFTAAPGFSKRCAEDLIKEANSAITLWAQSSPEYVHMATTLTLLLVKGRNAVWAHVGDSRLYLFEGNRIMEVTDDHSIAFMEFLEGKYEYDDIRRSENQNKLTNALGSSFRKAEIHDAVVVASDTAFLLCTDGWWEYVKEEQMEKALRHSRKTRTWIKKMLDIREKKAPANSDNYTALAVMI